MPLQINLPHSMWNYKLSGVYKISFEDGSFYIGSSVHLRSRAEVWNLLMKTKNGTPGKTIGTAVFEKILANLSASFDIIELCAAKDVRDKESFYLDKYKDDPNMVSNELCGAWKAILQYRPDGGFIKKHYSLSAAARYINTNIASIQRVLSGSRKSVKGMLFIYEHDYHSRRNQIIKSRYTKGERKNGRLIVMVDEKGCTIKSFKKMADAAKEVGCRPQNIKRVLVGQQKTAKGFIFKYS